MNKITLIKSRSARAGQELEFVFNPEIGFDNILTNYVYMKKEGLIGGAGRSFYITTKPDIKFSQKELKSKLESIPELRKEFNSVAKRSMLQFINTTAISTDKSEDPDPTEGEDVVINEPTAMPDHDETKAKKTRKK